MFRSGTTEVMSKLQAELSAGTSPADVLLIADAVAMTQLKDAGELMAYPNAPVEGIPTALIDPDMTFFGTKLITTGIVYNTDLVTDPPAEWTDLTDPDIAAQLIMPSPLYSGAAVIHVGTMVQQPEFGWGYYETLAGEGAVAGQGNGSVLEAVARGEKAYGIIIEYMAMNAAAEGSPVAFVFPSEGVSAITQPVAIMASTDAPDAAKAFVDFQLSRTAQEQSAAQGYFPRPRRRGPTQGLPRPGDAHHHAGRSAEDAGRRHRDEAGIRRPVWWLRRPVPPPARRPSAGARADPSCGVAAISRSRPPSPSSC